LKSEEESVYTDQIESTKTCKSARDFAITKFDSRDEEKSLSLSKSDLSNFTLPKDYPVFEITSLAKFVQGKLGKAIHEEQILENSDNILIHTVRDKVNQNEIELNDLKIDELGNVTEF
jgi:hypothetical protein